MHAVPLDVTLRPATEQDAAGIARVRVDSWRATYRGMIPDSYLDAMRVEDSAALWQRVLSVPEQSRPSVHVLESAGDIVGFASGMLLPEAKLGFEAELTGIYLMPAVQRQGWGQCLLKAVVTDCLQRGASNMLVWVIAGNKAARQFYEKLDAELLLEQPFTWDGFEAHEAGYGWRNLRSLLEGGALQAKN
jgi:ribosomal protein S18 acetylase RimI-like enzyme